jgi:adenosylmethionine-8-amino-7-oxononanoate aminotransferase
MHDELIRRDLAHIWHPCSQMKDYVDGHIPLIPLKRGEGVYLEDFEGQRYLDGISSWWVNLFGHAHPYINERIKAQLESLEHVIFAGFTHEPAISLAERITALAPAGLSRVFFTENGSSAVEVAIKMSFHAHLNRGQSRPLVISLENSYHGETLGALAVGDVALYKATYEPLLIRSLQAKSPAFVGSEAALKSMEAMLVARHEEVCAVIVEPLVQCAGGMAMYDADYLSGLRKLCDRFGVHLIADEIAVGFGRTGTLFACEQAGIAPDLMTLSKGLTGGYLPLALTLATDAIYEAFYCDYNEGKSFLHSHSYTANPLSCTAANATLDLFEQTGVIEANRVLIEQMGDRLSELATHPRVANVRQRGMIAACEIEGFEAAERVNLKIYRYALKEGVFLRPLANTLYFMPPYAITPDELDRLFSVARAAIDSL